MKKQKTAILSILFLLTALSLHVFAEPEQTVQKTFEKMKEVRLKLALGDCRIEASRDGKIHVDLVYSYEKGSFEPILEERGQRVTLEEKFHDDNPRGYSRWTLAIPEGTEIDFKSGTGNLFISGLTVDAKGSTGTGDIEIQKAKGEFRLSSGTGNVEVTEAEGEIEVSSGTGRVSIRSSKGTIEASSGTGDVEAEDITLVDDGEFSSGTGDVEVVLPTGEGFELNVSSGTDSAVVKLNGRPVQGYFEFTAQAKRGRIVSAESYDKQDEYREHDTLYLRKSFTRGKDTPKVYIRTGTGKAELKK